MSESVSAPGPPLPRVCSRQRHRTNISAGSPLDYYQRTVTVTFLDHLCAQLKERISKAQQKAYIDIFLLPYTIGSDRQWRERVKSVASVYETDLPSSLTLDAELGF